jgi:hypothetical protein
MAQSARLDIASWRNQARLLTLRIVGVDLSTGSNRLRAQVRQIEDAPGAPRIDLSQVTTTAQGLRVTDVEVADGVPTSTVTMRINKSTMDAMPYVGEIGDNARFAWALTVDGVTRLFGSFWVLATAIDSDAAPSNRPAGQGGGRPAVPQSGAVVSLLSDEARVTVSDVGLVAPLVVAAENARDAVKPIYGDGPPSPSQGVDGSWYRDMSDPFNPVEYFKIGATWTARGSLRGDPGPQGYSVVNLPQLKAAPTTDGPLNYDSAVWEFRAGNYTGQADDVDVVQSDTVALSSGAWVRQTADKIAYRYDAASVNQTTKDTVSRAPLNLYDKIPRNLWAAIESGTNTTDLTPYFMSAIGTGRAIRARQGRFRASIGVTGGNGISIRGEGKHLTYFENVDNTPILTLDSSTANIFEFELEDVWLENRNPGLFPTCDLIKITGAGDGETYQNDKHHFRNLWLFRGRDNLACDKRSIWVTLDCIESTGALRDAIHIETAANANQWSLRDLILKGAGRNALFIKHDFSSLMTGWSLFNVSMEDCGAEALRLTGTFGIQGMTLTGCTFENNVT